MVGHKSWNFYHSDIFSTSVQYTNGDRIFTTLYPDPKIFYFVLYKKSCSKEEMALIPQSRPTIFSSHSKTHGSVLFSFVVHQLL